ncbi:MAG: AAC(3)-I family aminoglycoside N-acetyltransferase [Pseudomonadota bacterium]
MGITFRHLTASEPDLMRELLNLFGRVFDMPETYSGAQPCDDYLRALLAGEQFVAVVAFEGQQLVGGLAAYELKKFEQARSEFYIYDLAVEETVRRRGVATGLIGYLRKLAADRGAYVIFVQADWGDDVPVALYSKLGAREDVHHFDIDVGHADG